MNETTKTINTEQLLQDLSQLYKSIENPNVAVTTSLEQLDHLAKCLMGGSYDVEKENKDDLGKPELTEAQVQVKKAHAELARINQIKPTCPVQELKLITKTL